MRLWGRTLEYFIVKGLARLFPSRWRVIPRFQDGAPLLRQFKIFDWLYLQSFVNSELKNWFHVHRWRKMISIVLSGAIIEERYPGGGPGSYPEGFYIFHGSPSVYSMDGTTIHRVDVALPMTWTLFFQFGDREQWGYFPRPQNQGYIPWDQMIPDKFRAKPL